VANQGNNQVLEFNTSATNLLTFGSLGTANGQFSSSNSPNNVAVGR